MSIMDSLKARLGLGRHDASPAANGHAATTTPNDTTPVTVLDLTGAYAAHRQGARFIDVRELAEWSDGHIAGAVHHPVDALERSPEVTVSHEQPVVTYCAAGIRAARAASALAANGYRDVRAMQAGYADWAAAGYPIEHPNDASRA